MYPTFFKRPDGNIRSCLFICSRATLFYMLIRNIHTYIPVLELGLLFVICSRICYLEQSNSTLRPVQCGAVRDGVFLCILFYVSSWLVTFPPCLLLRYSTRTRYVWTDGWMDVRVLVWVGGGLI